MGDTANSVLIQGATLADLEAIVNRAIDKRMAAFYERITPKQPVFIKRKEAAKLLGKSLPTLDSYAKIGLLHKKHIGGMVYFLEDEILSIKGRNT